MHYTNVIIISSDTWRHSPFNLHGETVTPESLLVKRLFDSQWVPNRIKKATNTQI